MSPMQREEKTDSLHHMIASIATEVDSYQQPTITFAEIQKLQKKLNKQQGKIISLKASRTRKLRKKKAGTRYNVARKLPDSGYEIGSLRSLPGILRNVMRFKELIRLKKVLSKELFEKLREQFQIIDGDGSGYISQDEVHRMNTLLAPHLTLAEVKKDFSVFFEAVEVSNHMSELQWLQSWARCVKERNYDLDCVQRFVDTFDGIHEQSNMQAVLGSDFASDLGLPIFSGLMKWKSRSVARLEKMQEEENYKVSEIVREQIAEIARRKEAQRAYEAAQKPFY